MLNPIFSLRKVSKNTIIVSRCVLHCVKQLGNCLKLFKVLNQTFLLNSILVNSIICLRNMLNNTSYLYNYLWFIKSNKLDIENKILDIEIVGVQNLIATMQKKKPIVLFTAYTGFFYLPLFSEKVTKCLESRKVGILVPNMTNKERTALKDKLSDFRLSEFEFIDFSKKYNSIRIYKILASNGIIVCTLDNSHPFTRNMRVPFLGRNALLPCGILYLVRKLNAVLIPCFTYKTKGNIFECLPSFSMTISNDEEVDIQSTMMEIAKVIESKILEKPEQWLMWESILNY